MIISISTFFYAWNANKKEIGIDDRRLIVVAES